MPQARIFAMSDSSIARTARAARREALELPFITFHCVWGFEGLPSSSAVRAKPEARKVFQQNPSPSLLFSRRDMETALSLRTPGFAPKPIRWDSNLSEPGNTGVPGAYTAMTYEPRRHEYGCRISRTREERNQTRQDRQRPSAFWPDYICTVLESPDSKKIGIIQHLEWPPQLVHIHVPGPEVEAFLETLFDWPLFSALAHICTWCGGCGDCRCQARFLRMAPVLTVSARAVLFDIETLRATILGFVSLQYIALVCRSVCGAWRTASGVKESLFVDDEWPLKQVATLIVPARVRSLTWRKGKSEFTITSDAAFAEFWANNLTNVTKADVDACSDICVPYTSLKELALRAITRDFIPRIQIVLSTGFTWPQLACLTLEAMRLGNDTLQGIAGCRLLTTLHILMCNGWTVWPAAFKTLPLTSISLTGADIGDRELQNICYTRVERLNILGARPTSLLPLTAAKKLKHLEFSHAGESLPAFALESLVVCVGGLAVSHELCLFLGKQTAMRSLKIEGPLRRLDHLEVFANPALRELDLGRIVFSSFGALRRRFPFLERLTTTCSVDDVSELAQLEGWGVDSLCIHNRVLVPSSNCLPTMKRLRRLRVLDARNRDLPKLVEVRSLEELELRTDEGITKASFDLLTSRLPYLANIHVVEAFATDWTGRTLRFE